MPAGTLLDRLRYLASQKDYFASQATCAEAADEIERLRAALTNMMAAIDDNDEIGAVAYIKTALGRKD